MAIRGETVEIKGIQYNNQLSYKPHSHHIGGEVFYLYRGIVCDAVAIALKDIDHGLQELPCLIR
jgi:hypothetical protein